MTCPDLTILTHHLLSKDYEGAGKFYITANLYRENSSLKQVDPQEVLPKYENGQNAGIC
jgi:hypothetical protein